MNRRARAVLLTCAALHALIRCASGEEAPPRPDTLTLTLAPGVTMPFVAIPATTSAAWRAASGGLDYYVMGDGGEYSPHRLVRLTYGFYISTTEVTQEQWTAIQGTNPSQHVKSGRPYAGVLPVDSIDREAARAFAARLAARLPPAASDLTPRLPTEAEWEYAARAGRRDATPEYVSATAWHGRASMAPMPVALKAPNAWGVFDMLGNLFEWAEDYWPPLEDLPLDDQGRVHVNPLGREGRWNIRGGAWYSDDHVRSFAWRADGYTVESEHNREHIGLRIVLGPALDQLNREPAPPPRASVLRLRSTGLPLTRLSRRRGSDRIDVLDAFRIEEYNDRVRLRVCYEAPAAAVLWAATWSGGRFTGHTSFDPVDVPAGKGCAEIDVGMRGPFDYTSDVIEVRANGAGSAAKFAYKKRWRFYPDAETLRPSSDPPRVAEALRQQASAPGAAAPPPSPSLRGMLFEWSESPIGSPPVLARLFTTGEQRVDEIIPLLSDPLRPIRVTAQRLLRYLGDARGMAAVGTRLERAPEERENAPIPVPLYDVDYELLERRVSGEIPPSPREYLVPLLYALGLDDTQRASALREAMERSEALGRAATSDPVRLGRCAARAIVPTPGERLQDAVFRSIPLTGSCQTPAAPSRGHGDFAEITATSADGRLVLLTMGWQSAPLAGAGYHVVVRKTEQGWRLVSVTQAWVS